MADSEHPGIDRADVVAVGDQLLRLRRRRATVYEGTVLENSAFRILWALADAPRTLRMLADELDLEQSTVNRQVHAAIDAGFVERYDVEGSVSRYLRPTEAGATAYEHDGAVRARLISAALAELGPHRARRLIDDLRAFNDAWDRAT